MPKISEYANAESLTMHNDYFVLEGPNGTKKIDAWKLINCLMKRPVSALSDAFKWQAMYPTLLSDIASRGTYDMDENYTFPIFSSDGKTYKTLHARDAIYALYDTMPWQCKRGIYRGKNLGSVITPEQYDSIGNTELPFKDLFLGDFWVIGGHRYVIADFNYWINYGDIECTTPHLAIMVLDLNIKKPMNPTDTTNGGYANSQMRLTGLSDIKTMIASDIGGSEHILAHRELLEDITDDSKGIGIAISTKWDNCDVEIPTEDMIYGHRFHGLMNGGTYNPTPDMCGGQFRALTLCGIKGLIGVSTHYYWLRDVKNKGCFAAIHPSGCAAGQLASQKGLTYVLPVFALCK